MGEQPSTTKEDWDLKYHDCLTCQVICVYKQVVKNMAPKILFLLIFKYHGYQGEQCSSQTIKLIEKKFDKLNFL